MTNPIGFGGKMKFTLIILGCFISSYAFANSIYKCVDASGKKDYQSSPCRPGIANSTLNIKTGGSTDLEKEKKEQELKKQEEQAKLDEQKLTKEQQKEKQEALKKEAIAESEKNQALVKANPVNYSAFAIPPYAPDKLPDFAKSFQDRLVDIEHLRRAAALKALASGQCERVEASELDPKSTKTELKFLINCSTGKPFYFTEQELKN
jgi:Skp family chaperone for outer membrane proteins